MATPKFTKKHYEAMVPVLREAVAIFRENADDVAHERYVGATVVISSLMGLFSQDNPRFDRDAFIAALKEKGNGRH